MFCGLLRVVAFPFADPQAVIFAQVWSGRVIRSPFSNMEAWTEHNKTSRGNGKGLPKPSFPTDADYMQEMLRPMHGVWEPKAIMEGKKRCRHFGVGKERWLRQNIHDVK